MSSIMNKRFVEETISMMGRKVAVETSDGKHYQGELIGINDHLDLILDHVISTNQSLFKIVLNGSFIKEIKLVEKPFELKALAERLNHVFPGLVKVREDIGVIMVMEKIKVTEQGVVEGTGLAVERVKAVFEEFKKDFKK